MPSYFTTVLKHHKVSTLKSLSDMNEGERNTQLLHMRLGEVDPLAGEILQHRLYHTKWRKNTVRE